MSLSNREKIILREIVYQFIMNAVPVSSTLIAKTSSLGMSPATIRNIMAALEKKGYIDQPHTSAGRVPRTMAYRVYVDCMMKKARLSSEEKEKIRDSLHTNTSSNFELDEVFKEIVSILAYLSQQLGIIISPRIQQGIFERMDLIKLSSEKLLVVISIQTGIIKTIVLGIDSAISGEELRLVSQILNERLHGMKIDEIRSHFSVIVKDIQYKENNLVNIFSQQANHLFDFDESGEFYFTGTHHIVQQQDFGNIETISSVVELLENGKIIVHLIDEDNDETPKIKIGEEIAEQSMQECSIITARYKVGNIDGIVGIIGPKRMNYSRLIPLVDFTARTLTTFHKSN